jgi:Fur family peroxide stress response transcriptional regulator
MKIKRYSKKRAAILDLLRNTDVHPSAEWIYQRLKPVYPDLSLGTVYRNITQLKNAHQLASVGVVNGHERYDAVTDMHPHFICTQCSCIFDLENVPMEEDLHEFIAQQYHVHIDHFDLVFHGICQDCLSQSIPSA